MLFAVVSQAHAQGLEADLDGNAGALQASEMRSQPQSSRQAKVAPRPQAKAADRQRVAAR